MSNTEIWDALGKTDPSATKGFKRSGGFSGTAVKPMWVLRRLTEQFGPAGKGWGVNEPKFELVHSQEGEVLVFCTVSAWHGDKTNILWGVGGDKAVTKNKNGVVHDDEAFKKAFTDAVGNAFKTLGVAADIHMGLFDDDKYVSEMEREFAPEPPKPPKAVTDFLEGLRTAYETNSAEAYWTANWPSVEHEWRPYALEQKEQIKAAQAKVDAVRAG
jgi:uncharacterized short protein YbdD (DUF466 family)